MQVQPGRNTTVAETRADYFGLLQHSGRENIQDQFDNCEVFRFKLYILRELLIKFIENKFREYIDNLSDKSCSSIKQTIEGNIRSTDPVTEHPVYLSSERRALIKRVHISQFTADWRTFAICYTGSFVARNNTHINHTAIDNADPKDLLEIIKNCSLFPQNFYTAARAVIGDRNRFYAHLSVLLINPRKFCAIVSATNSLIRLILEG